MLVIVRQPVPHVQQRLLVHRLVLERRVDGFAVLHRRPIFDEGRIAQRLENRLVCRTSEGEHLLARRPLGRGPAPRHGRIHTVRIDAALEEPLEPRVDAGMAQAALEKRNHAERR